MQQPASQIAFIGFGEAGSTIASTLGHASMRAHDLKLTDDGPDGNVPATAMLAAMTDAGVMPCHSYAATVAEADIIMSVVTADQAAHVAGLAARHLKAGALYLDMNSCAPSTKQAASGAVNKTGAIYVDVAIMAPIQPRGHNTPMLAATADPDMVSTRLAEIGLAPRFVGTEIGRASTIKMLRSVMIKGMEALTAECFRAAVRAGVHEDVAASLDASEGGPSWAGRAAYNMERMTEHGIRRAAEMREVAKTLLDLDVAPAMTTGTIAWEQQLGELDLKLDAEAPLAEVMAKIEAAIDVSPK